MTSTTIGTNSSPNACRGLRSVLAALVVGGGTATAAVLGAGTAAAEAPDVVGMSEAAAYQTLQENGVAYITLSRMGSGETCVISHQYDFVHSFTNHGADEPDVINTVSAWTGVGLDVTCS